MQAQKAKESVDKQAKKTTETVTRRSNHSHFDTRKVTVILGMKTGSQRSTLSTKWKQITPFTCNASAQN